MSCRYRFGLLCSVIFCCWLLCFFPSNIQYRTQENFCVYEITGLILLLWARLVLGKETRGRLKAELYSSKPARIPLSLGKSQRVAVALAAEKRGNKSGGEILRRAMHTSLHYEGQWKLAEDLPPGEGLMFFPSFSLVGHPEGRRWFICLAVTAEPFFFFDGEECKLSWFKLSSARNFL